VLPASASSALRVTTSRTPAHGTSSSYRSGVTRGTWPSTLAFEHSAKRLVLNDRSGSSEHGIPENPPPLRSSIP